MERYRIIPTMLMIICLLSLYVEPSFAEEKKSKISCVCIDAGHGGKDPGALGSSSKEKDIALSIALKFGKLLSEKYPDIKVIYTRKTDVFVDLKRRSQIANNSKADVFVSVHLNSESTKKARGVETLVLGTNSSDVNMQAAIRENSSLMYESDFSVTKKTFDPTSVESYILFNFIKNTHLNESLTLASYVQQELVKATGRQDRSVKQQPVWVLKDAAMPAILVEVGFISNVQEEKVLKSDAGQLTAAKAMLKAFGTYRDKMERNSVVISAPKVNVTNNNQELVNTKPATTSQAKKPVTQTIEKPIDANKTKPANVAVEAKQKPVEVVKASNAETVKLNDAKWFYAIQVASVVTPMTNISKLGLSEKVLCLEGDGRYRYYVIPTTSYSVVQKQLPIVRQKVKDAFIIGVKDGKLAKVQELRVLEANK